MAAALPASQALAQSGVFSGPPQVQPGPGGPDGGPGPAQGALPQGTAWIAVVGGFDSGGRRVSVGYSGPQRSRFDAEDAAIKACRRNEPAVACRGPIAASSGCLYAVVGNRPGGAVTWGKGATREAAFDDCQQGGFVCPSNKLIGGCVSGSN
jgi:hypothetical protein